MPNVKLSTNNIWAIHNIQLVWLYLSNIMLVYVGPTRVICNSDSDSWESLCQFPYFLIHVYCIISWANSWWFSKRTLLVLISATKTLYFDFFTSFRVIKASIPSEKVWETLQDRPSFILNTSYLDYYWTGFYIWYVVG